LKPNYEVKDNPLNWLDDVLGVEHQNFFEGRATTYMKAGLRGDVGKVSFSKVA
jgi:ribonucleotide reductase beta subunit family protein with ferritin-like domain